MMPNIDLTESEWLLLESMAAPGMTVLSHLYRLEDLGLVEKHGDTIRLTEAGVAALRSRHDH